jgi:hypothetical protein
MKKIFILLAAAPLSLSAQSPLIAVDKTSAYAFQNVYDLSGKLIPSDAGFAPEGNPYIIEFFKKGIVEFSNGKQTNDLFINYNLIDNTLRFRKDSNEYIMMNAVSGFILTDTDGITYEFKNNFPAAAQKTAATFYRVLSHGSTIQLIKYISKKVVSIYNYAMPETKKTESNNEYYLYDVANKKLIKIEKSIKSIAKALPAYEQAIYKYISKNDINVKSEEQLLGLVQYLDATPIVKY